MRGRLKRGGWRELDSWRGTHRSKAGGESGEGGEGPMEAEWLEEADGSWAGGEGPAEARRVERADGSGRVERADGSGATREGLPGGW